MSALNRIKGLVLSQMKGTPVELKKALTRVINAIDSDLDTEGYVTSSDTDEAFNELDKTLIELDESTDQPQTETEDLTFQRRKNLTNDSGYRDLSEAE